MKPRDRFLDVAIVFVGMVAFVITLAIGVLTLTGCGGVQGQRVGTAIATCSAKLTTDVAAVLDRNDPTLETELADIAKTMGLDALQCAIDIYDALKTSPTAMGSGSATPTTQAPTTNARRSAVTRARAWLAKQRATKGS